MPTIGYKSSLLCEVYVMYILNSSSLGKFLLCKKWKGRTLCIAYLPKVLKY